MTILRTSQWATAAVLLLSAVGLGSGLLARRFSQEAGRAAETRYQAGRLVAQLSAASERLLSAVRDYAATGDRRYYEDFVRELTEDRTRDRAVQGLRQLGLTPPEFALLVRSRQNADALIALDNRVFEAATKRNWAAALAIVHGPEYQQGKAAVRQPMAECQASLESRWTARASVLRGRAQLFSSLALVVLVLDAGIVLAVLGFYYRRRVVGPLASLTQDLRDLLARKDGVRIAHQQEPSEIGELARSLEACRRAVEEADRRHWVAGQLAEIARALSQANSLPEFAHQLLSRLVPQVQAGWGVCYLPEESGQRLQTIGCHGGPPFPDPERAFALGEGIVGQAARATAPLFVTDIPRDYPKIPSGRGEALPRLVAAVPVRSPDRLLAVVEVALGNALTASQQALLNDLGALVAPHLNGLWHQLRARELLDQTRRQAAELKERQGQLRAAEERARRAPTFRDLIHALPEAAFCLAETGIREANPAAATLLGWERAEELAGLHLRELAPETQADGSPSAELAEARTAAALQGEPLRFEWLLRKRAGEVFPAEIALSRIDLDGKPALLGLVRDLSERKRLEAELQTARQNLEEASVLKALCLASMSRDLPEPAEAYIETVPSASEPPPTPPEPAPEPSPLPETSPTLASVELAGPPDTDLSLSPTENEPPQEPTVGSSGFSPQEPTPPAEAGTTSPEFTGTVSSGQTAEPPQEPAVGSPGFSPLEAIPPAEAGTTSPEFTGAVSSGQTAEPPQEPTVGSPGFSPQEATRPAEAGTPSPGRKAARRKKTRVDDQMDLFAPGTPAEPVPAEDIAPAEPEPPSAAEMPAAPSVQADASAETEPATPPQLESAGTIPAALTEPSPVIEKSAAGSVETRASRRPRKPRRPAAEAEAAPAAVASADLPEIEGLDTADGLQRAEGNPRHYRKRLRQFVQDYARAAERIRDHLVQGEPEVAARVAQTLKDAAANVGATKVQAAAAALERAMANPNDPEETETLWDTLEKALHGLVSELRSALKPPERLASPEPPPPPLEPATHRPLVNQMLTLLAEADPGAADCMRDNRDAFRALFTPSAFVQFEQQVKAHAFSEALEPLQKAARKHGLAR